MHPKNRKKTITLRKGGAGAEKAPFLPECEPFSKSPYEMSEPKSKSRRLGTAPNMKAAAARMDLPPEMLKEAKDLGWDCFGSGGRVNCDAFLAKLAREPEFAKKWTKEGGIPPRSISQAIDAHFVALERKRRYEERVGKMIPHAVIGQRLFALANKQKAIAEQYIKDAKALAEFCGLMQGLVDEWTQPKANL